MHQYLANFMHSGNPNKSNVKYPNEWTPVYENWKRFGDGKGWMNMGMNILIPDEERDRSTNRSVHGRSLTVRDEPFGSINLIRKRSK